MQQRKSHGRQMNNVHVQKKNEKYHRNIQIANSVFNFEAFIKQ